MAEEQPFTTVPHGFHYHYDEPPKTPENELSPPPENKLPSPRGFRVRRRVRPRVNTSTISSRTNEIMAGLQENPVPSIEVSDQEEPTPMRIHVPQPSRRLLTPLHQIANTYPQTPSDQRFMRACTPSHSEATIKTSQRPSSPFSTLSDSSDDSFIDSEDGFSYGGSMTSPDSDFADPFNFESPSKGFGASQDLHNELPSSPTPNRFTPKKFWTKEMDNHIWTIYMTYLNDPTVTPFKTLPGCPPPVGVCHRVAREARKTWKGGRGALIQPKPPRVHREGSPDTVTQGSGDATPIVSPRNLSWPGAGSATRKRFRKLCKRKATIIPHYKRMLRSPSPYLGDAQIRSNRAGSPFTSGDSFATRNVAMALTTSTSTTMRPDGPLALMAAEGNPDWFNEEPQGPWASPAPVPSDVNSPENAGASITRLGSPFSGSHTWGPSRSRNHERVRAVSLHPSSTGTIPRLRSPVQFGSVSTQQTPSLFPAVRTPKRPAQTALEDELSNVDAQARRNRHDDVFGSSFQNASRRLRLRGLSLGTHVAQGSENASEPNTVAGAVVDAAARSSIFQSYPPVGVYAIGIDDPFSTTVRRDPAPRLGSPFPGISSRPTRSRGRHMVSLSLPMPPAVDLASIDQRMAEDTEMGN